MHLRNLVIIDTLALFNKIYFGYKNNPTRTVNNLPNYAVKGMFTYLSKLSKSYANSSIIFIIDSKEETYRKSFFPLYKGNRPEKEEDFIIQLEPCLNLIKHMGFPLISVNGFEADDVIATFVKRCTKSGFFDKIEVHTTDKDIYQIISNTCVIYNLNKKCIIDKDNILQHFPVEPHHVIDFLTITGDGCDNVSGIKGVGKESAVKLLKYFNSIENTIEKIKTTSFEHIGIKKNIHTNFVFEIDNNIENIYLAKKLISLKDDIEISLSTKLIQKKEMIQEEIDKILYIFEI